MKLGKGLKMFGLSFGKEFLHRPSMLFMMSTRDGIWDVKGCGCFVGLVLLSLFGFSTDAGAGFVSNSRKALSPFVM